MASRTSLQLLTLSDARDELRVEDTTAFDSRITAEIAAAVDFVQREIGDTVKLTGDDADDDVPPSLRQAVICTVRIFYSGEVDPSFRAVFTLLRPWRQLARGKS